MKQFSFSLGSVLGLLAIPSQHVSISPDDSGEMHIFLPFEYFENGTGNVHKIKVIYRGDMHHCGGIHLYRKNGMFYFRSAENQIKVWFTPEMVAYTEKHAIGVCASAPAYYMHRVFRELTDAGRKIVGKKLLEEFNLFYSQNAEEMEYELTERKKALKAADIANLKESIQKLEEQKIQLEKELAQLEE
jgi:hypothetical protein